MTPHAKAIDLFNEYYSYLKSKLIYDEEARQDSKECALIAVDEISEHCYEVMKPFWKEVKTEIEKL